MNWSEGCDKRLKECAKAIEEISSRLECFEGDSVKNYSRLESRLAAVEKWIRKAETMTLEPEEQLIRCRWCGLNWKPAVNTTHIPGDLCPLCCPPSKPDVPIIERHGDAYGIGTRCPKCGAVWSSLADYGHVPHPGYPCPKCAEREKPSPAPSTPILVIEDAVLICKQCLTVYLRRRDGTGSHPGYPCPKCAEKKVPGVRPDPSRRYPWTTTIGFLAWTAIQSMNLSWEEAWLYTTDRAAFDIYWRNKQKGGE